MTATLAQINAAASDPNLRARLELAAAEAGIAATDQDSRQAVWDNIVRVVTTPLPAHGEGQTLADVLAYSQAQYDAAVKALPPAPGSNPDIVRDDLIREAVQVALALNPDTTA